MSRARSARLPFASQTIGAGESLPGIAGGGANGPTKPTRFFGSVEIDMVRPVKSFDTILNAVIMELQRNPAAKVKLALEIEAESPVGFDDVDIGVVRDNARQLRIQGGFDGLRMRPCGLFGEFPDGWILVLRPGAR